MGTETYSATVEVGAVISSSLTTGLQTIKDGLTSISQIDFSGGLIGNYSLEQFVQTRDEVQALGLQVGGVQTAYNEATKQLTTLNKERKTFSSGLKKSYEDVKRLGKEGADAVSSAKGMGKLTAGFKSFGSISTTVGGAAGSIANFGKTVGNTITTAKNFTDKVAGTANSIGAFFSNSAAQAAEHKKLADSVGVTAEKFSAWTGIAEQAGLGATDVSGMMSTLTTSLKSATAAGDTGPVADALGRVGLSLKDLNGLSKEAQFETVAAALQGMKDPAEAAATANALLGQGSGQLVAELQRQEQGVDALLQKQIALNNEPAGGFVASFATSLGEGLVKVGEFTTGIVDVATTVTDTFSMVSEGMSWLSSGAQKVASMMGTSLSGVFSGFGSLMSGIGTTISSIASRVLPALTTGIRTVGMAIMANPIGAIIGLAVLGVMRLISVWDRLKKIFSSSDGWLTKIGKILGVVTGLGGDDEDDEKKVKEAEDAKKIAAKKAQSVGNVVAEQEATAYTYQTVPAMQPQSHVSQAAPMGQAQSSMYQPQPMQAEMVPQMPLAPAQCCQEMQAIANTAVSVGGEQRGPVTITNNFAIHTSDGLCPKEVGHEVKEQVVPLFDTSMAAAYA